MRRTNLFCPVLKCLVLVSDPRFTRADGIFMNSVCKFMVPLLFSASDLCVLKHVFEFLNFEPQHSYELKFL